MAMGEIIKADDADNKSKINTEDVEKLIKNNQQFFENMVLVSILRSIKFWRSCCENKINTVVSERRNSPSFNDFSNDIDNEIYSCVSEFYKMFYNDDISHDTCIILRSMFQSKINNGDLLEQDLEFLNNRLNDIKTLLDYDHIMFSMSILPMVKAGIGYWLEFRRVHQIAHQSRNKNIAADTLIENIQSAVSVVKTNTIQAISVDDAFNWDDGDSGDRIPIATLPILTSVLGGGVKRGEAGLFASISGGGKTVFTCQLIQGLILSNCKCVIFTTEQLANALQARMISSATSIPFDLLKDGVKKAMDLEWLDKNQIALVRDYMDATRNMFWFEHYTAENSYKKIRTHLDNDIKAYVETYGVEAVAFDWIGKGLKHNIDGNVKHHENMQYDANKYVEIIEKYNVFGLMTAQLDKVKAKDQTRVTGDMVRYCKGLDEQYTWAMGVSAIEDKAKQKANTLDAVYKTNQTFNVWKNRKSKAKHIPVLCQFDFQRFEEKEIYVDGSNPLNGMRQAPPPPIKTLSNGYSGDNGTVINI